MIRYSQTPLNPYPLDPWWMAQVMGYEGSIFVQNDKLRAEQSYGLWEVMGYEGSDCSTRSTIALDTPLRQG
ncbi:hypothetical protein BDQ12DRAFT_688336 [Crucibulum laeve]|uniref:Uncharacterized protein n=1 Tax=Crucibulum laeve TaxID=68775 RepID=A0A5C3LRB7_9AGAR|nr:hypothetical protein BDQ12DRAFT_688336 [Crucibulum laeve]